MPVWTGEANITRGAGRTGIIQMVSSNASLSYAQIAEARLTPDQPLFFQLYKHRDDKIAEQRVREVIALGYNAIFLTVDAIVAGNRERDVRAPFELEEQEREGTEDQAEKNEKNDADLLGTAGALVANDDLDMTWERTIPWLRSITKLPIVIKGIQSVEVRCLLVRFEELVLKWTTTGCCAGRGSRRRWNSPLQSRWPTTGIVSFSSCSVISYWLITVSQLITVH